MKKTKEEIRAYERARYAANIERERARKRAYSKTKKRKDQVKRWNKKNPHFSAVWQRENYRKWRRLALIALGGMKCSAPRCKISGDPDMLEIDHVQNDGKKERTSTSTITFLKNIVRTPNKKRYQVLCCNHNRKKQFSHLRKDIKCKSLKIS